MSEAALPPTPAPPSWIASNGPVVLDASFVLAVLDGEPRVQDHQVCLPGSTLLSVNLGEVIGKASQRAGRTLAAPIEQWLLASGVRLVDLPVAAVRHFPELMDVDRAASAAARAAGRRRSTLSLADRSVLGYAMHTGTSVLTGDRHWFDLRDHGLTVHVHLY